MQSTCSSPTDCTDRAVVTWFKPQPITATVCYCQFYLWWGGGQREREGVRGVERGRGSERKSFFHSCFKQFSVPLCLMVLHVISMVIFELFDSNIVQSVPDTISHLHNQHMCTPLPPAGDTNTYKYLQVQQ